MVTPVNDFDATLQAESKRTLAARGGIILSATSNVVSVAGGVGTPSIITLVASPLVVSGSVVFSTSPTVPLTLDPTGLIATLKYSDMGTSSVVVTVTLTANGITYTDKRTISQLTIGSLGYTGALNATANNTAQGPLASRPTGAGGDLYFATDTLTLYQNIGGTWQAAGNNFTNTAQLTDGAGLGQTAVWGNVSGSGKPADNATVNVVSQGTLASRPAGNNGDFYYATDLAVLYQKVSGSWGPAANNFTNTSQLTDGAGLGQTATWANVSGTGKPADGATRNTITSSTAAPASPVDGDIWVNTNTPVTINTRVSGAWVTGGKVPTALSQVDTAADSKLSGIAVGATANVVSQGTLAARPAGNNGDFYFATDTATLYQKVSGSWASAANNYTNTNQLTDGAGLGQTATWSNVTGTGRPADGATVNNVSTGLLSARPAGGNGDFYFATDTAVLYQKVSGAWVTAANNYTNTSQLTDGAGLGQTATWSNVSGTGKPADGATANATTSGTLASRPTGSNGDFYYATDTLTLYQKLNGAWVTSANAYTNTSQLTDGAGLGQTAVWTSVSSRPLDTTNLVAHGSFEDGSSAGWGVNVVSVTGQAFSKALQFSTRDTTESTNTFPVTPGETLYFESWLDASTANFDLAFGITLWKADGTQTWIGAATLAKPTGWTWKTGTITIPTGYIKAQPWLQIGDFNNLGTGRAALMRISRYQSGATAGATLGVNVSGKASSLASIGNTIGSFTTIGTGGKTVISDASIKIYDGNGALRVRIGDLNS